jgi:hypothetical protein
VLIEHRRVRVVGVGRQAILGDRAAGARIELTDIAGKTGGDRAAQNSDVRPKGGGSNPASAIIFSMS